MTSFAQRDENGALDCDKESAGEVTDNAARGDAVEYPPEIGASPVSFTGNVALDNSGARDTRRSGVRRAGSRRDTARPRAGGSSAAPETRRSGRRLEDISDSDFELIFERCMRAEDLFDYSLPPLPHRFAELTRLLTRGNERVNLTGIRTPGDICLKHYADSLKILPYLPQDALLLDVGCGAGFPTLPLALVREDLRITALDSVAKKTRFVAETAAALDLPNVKTLTARAEEAGRDPAYRERFDVVIARAVAQLDVLSEWCLPLARVGGLFLAMKGGRGEQELEAAMPRILECGGRVERVVRTTLSGMERLLILVRKVCHTPSAYPRRRVKRE